MTLFNPEHARIAVIGLGYVGLPLAVGFARHFPVVGFDLDPQRIDELQGGHDRTGETPSDALEASNALFTAESGEIDGCNVFIITVPTPVDGNDLPDLSALEAACRIVGPALAKGDLVVVESTVYPGVTETVCGPALSAASELLCGEDFFLGYSPERINPGDRQHTVEKIVKVVAGQSAAVTAFLVEFYGKVARGQVFAASDIRTAEAAKVIENAQRDINIAFINEVSMIFDSLGLDTEDVLATARTKWNFIDFRPGLVGGHCIGVDPFYLAHAARESGHEPEIVLAGRRINDRMASYVAERIAQLLGPPDGAGGTGRVLVLGLTFKENVPDLRNTKVVDLIKALAAKGFEVAVHDAIADEDQARRDYGIELLKELAQAKDYDCIIGAVAHDEYQRFGREDVVGLLKPGGLVADVKGIWKRLDLPGEIRRWQL